MQYTCSMIDPDKVRIPTPNQLRAFREAVGHARGLGKPITQAEAAKLVGVARRTWMYWESPERRKGENPQQPAKCHAILIATLLAEL